MWTPYNVSKLCNVLFTRELQARLSGTCAFLFSIGFRSHDVHLAAITTYSVHPGSVRTSLFRHFSVGLQFLHAFMAPFGKVQRFFRNRLCIEESALQTAEEGAQCSLFCALSDKAVPGDYHWDCARAYSSSLSKDMKLARELWEKSEQIIKLEDHLKIKA